VNGWLSAVPVMRRWRVPTLHVTADTFASADGRTLSVIVRVWRQWRADGSFTTSPACRLVAAVAARQLARITCVVCNMKISRPQPATIISIVALVMASGGSAVAAVSFARNAGAVDHKSAVGSGATLSHAAGKLITTQAKGTGKGKIASKYLDLGGVAGGSTSTFGRAFDVVDNATSVPTQIGGIPGLGPLTATCVDQNSAAGVEDPQTTITFQNTSGDIVNQSRQIGGSNPTVNAVLNGTVSSFNIGGSSTFELHLERKGTNYFVHGVVRQDGRGTNAASCLVYGLTLAVNG
jgi:hypothetical protein